MKGLRSSSFRICILCLIVFIATRILTAPWYNLEKVKVTHWDATGLYLYLPGTFIYHDLRKMAWYPRIDSLYGTDYQSPQLKNGNYVLKYLSGPAIMYSPFFFLAHFIAPYLHYAQDGFSPPYQLAICLASILYSFLGLLVLRKVLLRYFDEDVSAVSLLLVALATNFIQYAACDCGLTHSYLFALYCFQLYATMMWYERPQLKWAFVSGFIIGLAAITRPTDGVMLLIPLLWKPTGLTKGLNKWQLILKYRVDVFMAIAAAFIAVCPQLIYWKYVTGSWVYDIGSKWNFLNPWWRVLFGWTNGWFIYTPIMIFFVIGMFLMKDKPFKNAVITFFILNTWIVISWSDWHYGGTYSCRALVQSYPVLTLALAPCVGWCIKGIRKFIFFPLWGYLLYANLFQVYQYNAGILHYNKMNRAYYEAIYLNHHPFPLDMSLLDTEDRLYDESRYKQEIIFEQKDTTWNLSPGKHLIASIPLNTNLHPDSKDIWIRVDLDGITYKGLWDSYLNSDLVLADSTVERTFNMANALNKENESTKVSFYQHILAGSVPTDYRLFLHNTYTQNTRIKDIEIRIYYR